MLLHKTRHESLYPSTNSNFLANFLLISNNDKDYYLHKFYTCCAPQAYVSTICEFSIDTKVFENFEEICTSLQIYADDGLSM